MSDYVNHPTPGPWEVKFFPNQSQFAGKFFVAAKTPEDHPHFGHTTMVDICFDEDYPSKLADAAMISASHEMLNALKRFTNAMRSGDKPSLLELIETLHQADAAISKATTLPAGG